MQYVCFLCFEFAFHFLCGGECGELVRQARLLHWAAHTLATPLFFIEVGNLTHKITKTN